MKATANAQKRVLFVLKSRQVYGSGYSTSGLQNSAQFVADMLSYNGFTCKTVTVVDGNDIDREAHAFQPDVVVLEAIWCPPYKLRELADLYPAVLWVIRGHSEIPFLANEGMAIEWILEYQKIPGVVFAVNSEQTAHDLHAHYLPNYYPQIGRLEQPENELLHIGCYGAIRPLKNQLAQAFAAIRYAEECKVPLRFHVNATRVEQGGEQVLKNLRSLFAKDPCNQLVEDEWIDRVGFLTLIGSMDVCMAVSFTETYCIVAADAVSQHVALVTSSEVAWANPEIHADPNNISDMVAKLRIARGWRRKNLIHNNLQGLRRYNELSTEIWINFLHQFD